ncbi:MAG: S9 family peptidase [Candidatus Eremiobacteraeota bacterium]|nr:S9 family peptidase [Candidatus Eremiobacteraeota bacterium]
MKRYAPVAFALVLSLCDGVVAQSRPMIIDDYKSLVGVSDAQISPDGKSVAYIVSRPNYKTDRAQRTLMLYELASGIQRSLTFERKGLAEPTWSPDASRIAILSSVGEGKDAKEQVFVMDLRGGDPVPVTHAVLGVQQFAWRPDGKAIAYVTADEPADKKARAHHLDGFLVGDQAYTDLAAPTPNHIWLVDSDGSNSKRLTRGSWSLPTAQPPSSPASPLSWSPDGRYISFTKMPNAYDADGDRAVVAVLDTTTGAIRAVTSHGRLEGYGEFSPDGSKIAYWYPFHGDGAAQNDIFVAPSSGGDGTDVSAQDIDTNVQRAIWMPDSRSLLISGHKGTDAALWLKPLDDVAKRLKLDGAQPVQSFWLDASVSKTGAIAFAGSKADHPVELFYMSSVDAAPRRLTSYNETVANLNLGKVAPVEWQSREGFREDGVITYPPDYRLGRTYPLVLVIHGGPNSASITNFSAFNQVLAAHGWIVFNPNYRGSDNLGEAYWHAIFNDSGAGPGRDVIAGIQAVRNAVSIDAGRIGISGWSYGGYMTSWMIGHYHVWRAAVSGAAVNDLVDEYALADNGVGWRYNIGGSPYRDGLLKNYIDQSPITYAWNVTTPTLILSDTGDARVPITQSYKMYRALKDRGTTVKFFAYPVEGHFPGDPVRALDVNRRWMEWLEKYLK